MIRGTTPIIQLFIDGADLTGTRFFVTLVNINSGIEYTFDSEHDNVELVSVDENGSQVNLSLTQEMTLNMTVGRIQIQVRWIDDVENAEATDIATIDLTKVLLEKKISYTGGVV